MLVLTAALLVAPAARSASSDIVVSQVFAGGGNSGAAYANDFVELFNRGSSSVDVSGWTIQYASASSTSWQATALSGSIAPGRYYLVQLASGGANGAALPTVDATGTSNLAVSGGKVALVRSNAGLTCGATAGSCSASSSVADLIGYGSATDYEGSAAAAALSGTTAALRGTGGCADTDANASDFSAVAPAPRNSATAAAQCGGGQQPPPGDSASQGASVDVDVQSALSISLERSSISFANAHSGETPSAVSEKVTVVSNNATGYALSVHRSAFQPSELPLGLSAGSAPAGGQLGGSLAGGAIVAIPIAPATDLLIGTASARSATGGDVWPASIGFASPLPVVGAGHYTSTVTFTVIAR
jgi:hypothetical protein